MRRFLGERLPDYMVPAAFTFRRRWPLTPAGKVDRRALAERPAGADMADLEQQLQESRESRRRLIATDGVFSMDGNIAPLADICELAERYEAMVMVEDVCMVHSSLSPDSPSESTLK